MDSIQVKELEDEAYLESVLPPGFKFKPKDDELCFYYLARKIANQPLCPNPIKSVNIYDYDPDSLTRMYKKQRLLADSDDDDDDDDEEEIEDWYFFTPRVKRYKNGKRPNREAGAGFWKATSADTNINRRSGKREVVGMKKTLAYFKGKPGRKGKGSAANTNWIMEEFVLVSPPSDDQTYHSTPTTSTDDNTMLLDEWVCCRIHQHKRHQEDRQQKTTVHQPANIIEANDQHQHPLNNGYSHIEAPANVQSSTPPMPMMMSNNRVPSSSSSSFAHHPTASGINDQAPVATDQIIQPNQHHFQGPCHSDQAINWEAPATTEIIQGNQHHFEGPCYFEQEYFDLDDLLNI